MRPTATSRRSTVLAAGAALLLLFAADASAQSPAPVALGAAGPFAVLGAATVTSAGVSTLTGDLGVSPGTAITGFPPGVVHGSAEAGTAAAARAHTDVATAYGDLAGRTPTAPAGVLDGLTLGPGVYAGDAALALAGGLTLDAGGDPEAVFILQAVSTLTTAAGSHVDLAGGAQACNVFWLVGSSATLGASSGLRGTVVASTSITVGDGVTVDGRLLVRDAAITLINDTVTVPRCGGSLTHSVPTLTPFTMQITGATRTVGVAVGAWGVDDARGTGAGYVITVAASAPTVDGSTAAAGTGPQLRLQPATATAAAGNAATTGPVAMPRQTLTPTASTIESAASGTGQGAWQFAADASADPSLAVTIPGDATAGAFASTLTFTTAAPAA